jgi:hypothetical protein
MLDYDSSEVEPSMGPLAVPGGQYLAAIVSELEKKTNEAATIDDASYIQLTFEILEGPHKGSKVWDLLNLNNPSQACVVSARGRVSTIRQACGLKVLRDTIELQNIPMLIDVIQGEYKGKKNNKIVDYKPAGSTSPPAAGAEKQEWEK